MSSKEGDGIYVLFYTFLVPMVGYWFFNCF